MTQRRPLTFACPSCPQDFEQDGFCDICGRRLRPLNTLPPARYRCPACGQTVGVAVPHSAPPTCSRHIGGGRLMTKEDDDE